MFKHLDETISVSPQIDAEGVRAAAAQGIKLIINNRPDDEAADQPKGTDIKQLAESLGIDYHAIPVTQAGFSATQIDGMATALSHAGGPTLAFCRSGTRSTLLWALARAKQGDAPDMLEAKAAAAGYSLAPIRAMLDMLAAAK